MKDLFEKANEGEKDESEESGGEGQGQLSISKRELRRRTESIHKGRKPETKAKREKRKMLEKLKVVNCELFILCFMKFLNIEFRLIFFSYDKKRMKNR